RLPGALHHIRAPDELTALDHETLARRVDQHRLRGLGARDDTDQLQLVERILTEDDLALRMHVRLRIFRELGSKGAERIARALALAELVFLDVHLRRRRRGRIRSRSRGARTRD